MKSKRICTALDTVSPTAAQKDRMRRALEARLPRENTPVVGRYQAKAPRRRPWAWVPAAAMLALALAGGFFLLTRIPQDAALAPPETTAPVETTLPSDTQETVPPITAQETVPPTTQASTDYSETLDKYRTAIREGWDQARCAQEDMSPMTAAAANRDAWGYALMDLDGDGSQELLISDGNVIFDLYSGSTHILSGYERSAWYLCQGNVLKNQGSSSAAASLTAYYALDDQSLQTVQIVHFAADVDMENPWFLETPASPDHLPLTEQEAQEAMDRYPAVSIDIQPLL